VQADRPVKTKRAKILMQKSLQRLIQVTLANSFKEE
jgi:hypothetical protein